jgi:hypothetical protein
MFNQLNKIIMKKDEFNPHAYMSLSNFGGVSIELNDSGKSVRYQWYDEKPSRPCRLYYTNKGDAYFRIYGRRYYLRDFMRI